MWSLLESEAVSADCSALEQANEKSESRDCAVACDVQHARANEYLPSDMCRTVEQMKMKMKM